ncbi:MAG: DUF411 domain-containing protein [Gammaproteobacteria bacterium]|nr:DUF411 domain-containing protein [Gammaproteobacteria bacterium]MYD75298.1 DUF411 domain-containing protein [Gammaproteobacteria bacterium]MYJ51491.1 DUF411 domain-containing protein [Gammaproteobacteria bacterium]
MVDRSSSSNPIPGHKRPATSRRLFSLFALAAIGIAVSAYLAVDGTADVDQQVFADVTVYKNPSCGCCGKWVEHLEHNGFQVEVVNQPDVIIHKRKLGVPQRLFSCHTAEVGGYVIEGHVPADDIKRLLVETPAYRGLAVPGMPQGSPGMETGRIDSYDVLAFGAGKPEKVFSHYPGEHTGSE